MKSLSISAFIICILFSTPTISSELHLKVGSLLRNNENFISRSIRIKNTDIRGAHVEALIFNSASTVINVLRDFGSYKEFIPFFTGSKILSTSDNGSIISLKASILKGAIDINAIISVREIISSSGVTRFTLRLHDGDLERMDGTWVVYPIDDNLSILVFDLMIDPGLWFVRDNAVSRYNRVNARRIIRSIRKRLKTGISP